LACCTFKATAALSRNDGLRSDGPFTGLCQAMQTIPAVPTAEKRFISATRILISAD